ncbi:hypothetical protein ACFL4D_01750 [Candidatus Margulisiibacteriota bacterium]
MINLKEIKDPELHYYCKKLKDKNIDLSDFQADTVYDFLLNVYSGYQQLADTICDVLLKDRKLKGNAVPIDNVKASYHYFYNSKHSTDIPFFDTFKDSDVLKAAILFRWKEKNPDSKLDTFNAIAPKRIKKK